MTTKAAVAVGNTLVGAGMMLYLGGPSAAVLVVGTLVWTAGEMIGTPTMAVYPGRIAPAGLRAHYLAGLEFAVQIGYAAGPALGVALWAVWPDGVRWMCGVLTVVSVLGSTAAITEPRSRAEPPGS